MPQVNILVVEDESIIALDIKNSLLQAGYGVVAIATSATEALKQVSERQPDLVLMDICLKGNMDGVQAAEQIYTHFHVPVIYLTAHADENTLHRAKITAPFAYVLKPFEDRELITTIEMALYRHQSELATLRALQREKELNHLRSRFVSLVSHEFRNPLSTILFSSEMLDRYGEQLSQQKRQIHLHRIQESVKRMNQLLNDVLMIGEAEANRLNFNPHQIDVARFCKDLVDEFQLGIESSYKLRFANQSDGTTPSLPALVSLDEKLLRPILTNLLSNAIKYSPEGGEIQFYLIIRPAEIVFQIQDHGLGIPVQDQEHLFTSFHRAENVKSIPGSGLGLSVVKHCVEMHRGKISFTTEVGSGTTFTVVLPSTY